MDTDVLVVGAGAAGLMAALAARGAIDDKGGPARPGGAPPLRVVALDASTRLGLKILLSGGGRCNVTNEAVDESDFTTDAPHLLRGLLRGFPVASVCAFFARHGVELVAEPIGKLFPATQRAADVLAALQRAAAQAQVTIQAGADVASVERAGAVWRARTGGGAEFTARRVIVATGGKSLPRTGSRGFGYELAAQLGHAVLPPRPALTPLFLAEGNALAGLAGLTWPAILTVAPAGTAPEQIAATRARPIARATGSLLVTHRGLSGPAALDVSGAAGAALAAGGAVSVFADFVSLTRHEGPWAEFVDLRKPPGSCLPPAATPRPLGYEEWMAIVPQLSFDPRRSMAVCLADHLPRALVDALAPRAGFNFARRAREATPTDWRRIWQAFAHCELPVSGTDDWSKAEVTAGGVPLAELDRRTLESRVAPGLHFCGEVVAVTGRLGGFNFQWAWSSGFAAGRGAAAALGDRTRE